ncbi:unnamed protein product [Linum trigynum]|uniref:Uncharacterized protein n=1 Tax=Linum trigynum TaxID=586398 RepID=A0AAV2CPG1_9ROSI
MSSNPRVTITLGRSGQVVTKEGKRPPGEGSWMSSSKRHRGDCMKWSPGLSGEKVHPTSSRSNEAPMSNRTQSRPSSSSQYSDLRPPTYPEEYASENGITYSSQFAVGGSRRARYPDRISRPTRELSPPRISMQSKARFYLEALG